MTDFIVAHQQQAHMSCTYFGLQVSVSLCGSHPLRIVYINASALSTVQKWERGANRPSGPCCKLIHLIEERGVMAVL